MPVTAANLALALADAGRMSGAVSQALAEYANQLVAEQQKWAPIRPYGIPLMDQLRDAVDRSIGPFLPHRLLFRHRNFP